ncbi:MAG: hypothetical protein M0014_16185 [Actinomycetota bacterium]|jgi:hypothetical protein|nr:hypothetical protein [Actinomycetota bacterium]
MTGDLRRDGTPVTEPQAPRGYRWEDAKPGNLLAVRHGARSERLVSERAAQVLDELRETYAWLIDADVVVLDVLCRAKARHDALADYVEGVIEGTVEAYPRKGFPQTGIEAVPDRTWQQLSRETRTIIDAAAKLGFTATDRAQLMKDTGMARHFGGERVAQLVERGRQLREAAQ